MPPPGGPLLRNGRTCLCVCLPLSELLAYGLQGLGKQRLRNDTPRKKELHDLTRNKCSSEIGPSPRYLTVGFFFFLSKNNVFGKKRAYENRKKKSITGTLHGLNVKTGANYYHIGRATFL